MQILDILRASHGGETPKQIAGAFGLDQQAADVVTEDLVGELSRAIERNTLNRGGVSDLVELVGHSDHVKYFDGDADLTSPEAKQAGDALLAQILGTKHESRGVADRVAKHSGVPSDVIRQMLPSVAAMMMGGMERQLGGELGDLAQRFGSGTSTIAPQQPLPLPSDTQDYGPAGGRGGGQTRSPFDDLSDMIRRGGGRGRQRQTQGQPQVSGSDLSQIVRQIFGNLFGFQNKGVTSWIIQLIVFRILWPMIKSIFRRLFLGR